MTRDEDVAAVVEAARGVRRHPPRVLWIVSLVIGGICAFGFVKILLTDPTPVAAHAPVPTAPHGPGFLTGVLVGLAVGIVLGIAVQSARGAGRHSARSSP